MLQHNFGTAVDHPFLPDGVVVVKIVQSHTDLLVAKAHIAFLPVKPTMNAILSVCLNSVKNCFKRNFEALSLHADYD